MTVQDWLGADNTLGIDIWEKKYRHDNETFDEWLDRVSGFDAAVRQLIVDKKFIFGGRILSNRGIISDKLSMSNCYVVTPPEDNLESIFDTAKKLARTYSYGGGCGTDLSKLSPKGAKVRNAAKESSGAVSFMDLYSLVTGLISQNGRRGALMLSMSCEHPDIEEFIDIKTDLDRVTKANISVRMTNAFMKAVEADADFKLTFKRNETGEVIEKTVHARDIMRKLAHNNWDMGEPGILFWDNIEKHNFLSGYDNFSYAGTNPCLSGNTLIQTIEGVVQIKDLVGKTYDVYCMDDDGNLTISTATKTWKTRENAQTVTVYTPKGNLTCTPDHMIYTVNRGWVCAHELKRGDRIKGLNRSMKDERHVAVCLSGGEYVAEHRFVAGHYGNIENKDVHHVDGDPFNNALSNLQILEHSVHSAMSNTGRHIEVVRDKFGRYVKKAVKHKRLSVNQNKRIGCGWFVQKVEYNTTIEDVYDITVERYHNFIANDMVVHNCAEEPLPAGGSCLLGSMNLSEYVDKNGDFDYSMFVNDVGVAVRALNDVLDEGLPKHPLQEQRDSVRDWRQIGLGIMGLADALIKMGIQYGSLAAVDMSYRIAREMLNAAVKTSAMLAKEDGSFPKFNLRNTTSSEMFQLLWGDVQNLVCTYGMRNSQLLTIAPTGTLSTMLGISGGIEPVFANSYTRKTQSLFGDDVFYKVYTPLVKVYMDQQGLEDDSNLPDYFVTSADIDYHDRIAMQAAWQQYIDASISSTVNLPEDATEEDVFDLYMTAWKAGLKGITVFRNNCRRAAVLFTEPKKEESATNDDTPKRGEIVATSDNLIGKKRKIRSGCGSLHCEAFFDPSTGDLMETFFSKGSTGGCNSFMVGLSRMISLSARAGVDIHGIVDQLNSCPVCPSYAVRKATKNDVSKGACCPTAIANALMDMYNEMQSELKTKSAQTTQTVHESEPKPESAKAKVTNNLSVCPECGEPTTREGGCIQCKSCGWSKCD